MSAKSEGKVETAPEEETIERLKELAKQFYQQFAEGDVPHIDMPTRSKSNIEYDSDEDVWVYGDSSSTKSANSTSGAKTIAKYVYTIEFLMQQLREGRSSTLRELYYLSESWENEYAQFDGQDQSNGIIEDLEVITGINREDLHMRPEESGATVIGPLEIREQTRDGTREIHCQQDVGEGGYQIPNTADQIEFLDNDADFVLCVETGGMRDRLVENGFDDDYNAVVVHLKGQPARSTRRLTKRLHDEVGLPVTVFTDGDPWSYRIFASVAYGSIKSAHLSTYLATPQADFIGVRPRDIVEYDLPTDPLSEQDEKALNSMQSDPRFQSEFWETEIQEQLDIGVKSEQQSLASYGLDFVTDTYLPERLDEMDLI